MAENLVPIEKESVGTKEPLMEQIIQLPIKHKKPLNSFKEEAITRREELLILVNALGIMGTRLQSKTLAEKYKVSRQTIYNDVNWIIGNYKPSNLREIKIDLKIARDRALQKALDLLAYAQSPDDKVKGIASVIAAARHYREELEAWGEKEKVAEKVNITSKSISLEIIRHDGRTENKSEDGIEPEAGRSTGPIERQDTH